MLEFVMNERPAEVSKWLKQPLKKKEVERIMSKSRGELTYKELVIKSRILQENGSTINKYYAPKGARVPQAHPSTPTIFTAVSGTKGY